MYIYIYYMLPLALSTYYVQLLPHRKSLANHQTNYGEQCSKLHMEDGMGARPPRSELRSGMSHPACCATLFLL